MSAAGGLDGPGVDVAAPVGRPSVPDGGALPVSVALIERWAKAEALRVGPGTVRRSRWGLMSLARRLGDRPLTEATIDDIEAWLAPLASETRSHYSGAVRSFSNWAVAERVMADYLLPERKEPAQPPTSTALWAMKYLAEKQGVGTISKMTEVRNRGVLFRFCALCPPDPAKITRRDAIRWMKTHRNLAATTRRLYFTLGRGFTVWLQQRGILRRDPFAEIPPPRLPKPVHRALDAEQVAALIAACETRREHVLLLLALHTGMRRLELARLEIGDVSLSGRTVQVRQGKRGDSRLLPLSDEAARVLGGYLSSEGLTAGPLLRNEAHPERGISPQTVWRIFNAVAKRSGVKVRAGDGIATHATRHTCATDAHRATGDVLVVQALLGHSSLQTTERYIRSVSVEHLRAAVQSRSYLPAAVEPAAPTTEAAR